MSAGVLPGLAFAAVDALQGGPDSMIRSIREQNQMFGISALATSCLTLTLRSLSSGAEASDLPLERTPSMVKIASDLQTQGMRIWAATINASRGDTKVIRLRAAGFGQYSRHIILQIPAFAEGRYTDISGWTSVAMNEEDLVDFTVGIVSFTAATVGVEARLIGITQEDLIDRYRLESFRAESNSA